jgi:hypothetical protein
MDVKQVLPPDAIPSVDDPAFVDAYGGDPDDEVVVVELGDDTRAYPLRYLNYHEIVNDVVAGRSIAVTWCPLCASAVVYDREVDGDVLEFGVSGKLADDDLVMYDRQTESEWKQSLGEAIAGPYEGTELTALAAAVMPYRRFDEEHPDGMVMDEPGGESEAGGPGDEPEPIEYEDDPYREYVETDGFGLGAHRGTGGRDWRRDDLEPKEVVLGVERDGEALGFPYDRVGAAGGVVQATVGRDAVAVFLTPDGIHAFDAAGFAFAPTDEAGRFAAGGTTWDGATGEADDGRHLERVPARRLFAFAWQDDHGPDAFVEP